MKPTLPEDRELEAVRSEVSARYRAGSTEEPPARLDAAILESARREAARPRFSRNWHVPASIAAVLVIGVSIALMVRDIEEPLPPLDQSAQRQLELAKPVAPEPPTKAAPKAKSTVPLPAERDFRPSRERSDREADMRELPPPAAEYADSGAAAPPAAPAPAPALQQLERAAPADAAAEQEKKLADSVEETRTVAGALRKEAAMASVVPAPEEWVQKIETLLRDGQTAEAREQLAQFRKRYPDYRLPDRLRALDAEPK
jgi:hypothetical protein